MIDYKYPTIASGATPIGSAGRAPDEDLLWENHQWKKNKEENLRVDKLDIYSHRESGFNNPTILAITFEVEDFNKSKFEEAEDIWSRKLKKSKNLKIEEVKDRKKSKIEEVEDLKFETQPKSATQVESRGLLTWVCPLGTHGLVYRVWPIKEVDRHKDSTSWLGVLEGRL
jgi:hypothetical protein